MNTEVDLGLSRYSDLAFTWSVIVLLLAMLMLAVELASSRVRRVEERELVAAGPASLRSADLDRPGVVVQAPVTPMAERVGKAGLGLVYLGIALLFACIVLRGLATSRAPWGNMYEFINLTSFCGLLAAAVVLRKPQFRTLWVFVLVPVLVLLTVSGKWLYTHAAPVMPALQSANISAKLLKVLGGANVIGPQLLGLSKPVEIGRLDATTSDIVTNAVLAAHDAIR